MFQITLSISKFLNKDFTCMVCYEFSKLDSRSEPLTVSFKFTKIPTNNSSDLGKW